MLLKKNKQTSADPAICKELIEELERLKQKERELKIKLEAFEESAASSSAESAGDWNLASVEKKLKQQKRKNFRITAVGVLGAALIAAAGVSGVTSILAYYTAGETEYQDSVYEEILQSEYNERSALQAQVIQLSQEKLALQKNESQNPPVYESKNKSEIAAYIKGLPKKSSKQIEKIYVGDEIYYTGRQVVTLPRYTNLNPGTSDIYPGALLRGDSLFQEELTGIAIERGSLKLASNLTGTAQTEIKSPDYQSVRSGIEKMIAPVEDYSAKTLDYQMTRVDDQQDLMNKLGAGISIPGITLKDTLENQFSSQKTHIVIELNQTYFTVSADPPKSPELMFAEGADMASLGVYSPAYISGVDYGKKVLMIASSDMDEETMRNELKAGLSLIKGVRVENKTESKKTHSKITCSLLMIGGSSRGNDGLFQNKYDSLSSCIEEMDSFINQDQTKLTDLVPVSYSLKYAADNAPVPCVLVRNELTIPAGEAEILEISMAENQAPGDWTAYFECTDKNMVILEPSCLKVADSQIVSDQVVRILKNGFGMAPLYCRVTITDTGGEWLRDWIALKNASISIDYNSAKKNAVTTLDLYKLDKFIGEIYIKNPFAVCDVRRSDVIPEIN